MEEVIELPLSEVERFTLEKMEEEVPMLMMGFCEDELILMSSLAKQLLDLSVIMGSEPPMEMLALESRFEEASAEFFEGEELEEEE